jgi:hypothetical protein
MSDFKKPKCKPCGHPMFFNDALLLGKGYQNHAAKIQIFDYFVLQTDPKKAFQLEEVFQLGMFQLEVVDCT